MYTRRMWLQTMLAGGAVVLLPASLRSAGAKPVITVYKSPSCGCCADWAKHLSFNGFDVRIRDVEDVDAVKTRYHVPETMFSCHTAVVGGYVVEGHVPADLIHKLLREKRRVVGIAVPGMPMGSPGMEETSGEHAGHKEPYTVYLFDRGGRTTLYAKR